MTGGDVRSNTAVTLNRAYLYLYSGLHIHKYAI